MQTPYRMRMQGKSHPTITAAKTSDGRRQFRALGKKQSREQNGPKLYELALHPLNNKDETSKDTICTTTANNVII